MIDPQIQSALFEDLQREAAEIVAEMDRVPPPALGKFLANKTLAYVESCRALDVNPVLVALHLGLAIGAALNEVEDESEG